MGDLHAVTEHKEVENARGQLIRIGQEWEDSNPTRDPIRRLKVEAIEEQYGHRQAVCSITRGIDRASGNLIQIDERIVKIDIERLHPSRSGYSLVT